MKFSYAEVRVDSLDSKFDGPFQSRRSAPLLKGHTSPGKHYFKCFNLRNSYSYMQRAGLIIGYDFDPSGPSAYIYSVIRTHPIIGYRNR